MTHANPLVSMSAQVHKNAKQGEYATDEQSGQVIHTSYGFDPEFGGTVLPTARMDMAKDAKCPTIRAAFDANNPNVIQNIIDTTEGHTVLQSIQMGGRGAKKASTTPAPAPAAATPKPSKGGSNLLMLKAIASYQADQRRVMGITRDKTTAKKKTSKKKARKSVAATAVERPSPDNREESEAVNSGPTLVRIAGEFGAVVQPFYDVFIDGMCLVLVTDNANTGATYELPPIKGDPIMLAVSWAGQHIDAIWAGIKFTMPSGAVTFHVLLIPEEADRLTGQDQPPEPVDPFSM